MEVVLITGSRSITERDKIFKRLDDLVNPDEVYVFIEGGAEGVDQISSEWCGLNQVNNKTMTITPAHYEQFGNGAGNMRNQDMLDFALEISGREKIKIHGIAFWDGSSTGTMDMIKRMRKAGVEPDIILMGKPKTKRLI